MIYRRQYRESGRVQFGTTLLKSGCTICKNKRDDCIFLKMTEATENIFGLTLSIWESKAGVGRHSCDGTSRGKHRRVKHYEEEQL